MSMPAKITSHGPAVPPKPAPITMEVTVKSMAVFSMTFTVQWDGGCSQESNTILAFGDASIDFYGPPQGTSCWLRADISLGPTHDSADNFNFQPGGHVHYTISGSLFQMSWKRD